MSRALVQGGRGNRDVIDSTHERSR
jgi:hypothetical protein